MGRRPILAFTPGEPAGIGPDLAVLRKTDLPADIVIIADPDLLATRAQLRGRRWQVPLYGEGGPMTVLPIDLPYLTQPGVVDPRNASYVLRCLERAASGCLIGEFDALVTGPVHKAVINDAGIPFSGHTEFLAKQAGVAEVVMLLVTGSLRVALVTTHLPLRAVSDAITAERLDAVLNILARSLVQDFGILAPRISVLGLNPHAGEDGHLGHEDGDIIMPAVARAQAAGFSVVGPVPADTAFIPAQLIGIDAILAMYHDQGLPVLKAQGFGDAVNITLGLPFVRTSVDHGTALDRAGVGPVDLGSLNQALDMACQLASRRVRA